MSTERLYDLGFINQVAKGNQALQERLCRSFVSSANGGLEELHQALAENNLENIGKAAHKLKSTIEAMRVIEGTRLIKLIEKSARLNVNVEAIPEMIHDATTIIRETVTQLQTDLQLQ
ncbi:HPt (histidine-containing phosphotransfer) domain-containing protein [Filimonas lacunae]|uniref:HPt (Histidine-containing phosphotransfer) domain-containing protein n=1 Tax=Filimonas lacunae TaxID=477680 RepID=A0A173MMZ1_9BACT|nr:Hpt domain-containing protein [Filimonas lacunae]BAV08820.1 hypothetical protein FLA_4867 [Filimonas lacunae]SIS62246.1 HPt (histidine-containing phosphotransfer) domain-containing protein [Filimonas lacunae]